MLKRCNNCNTVQSEELETCFVCRGRIFSAPFSYDDNEPVDEFALWVENYQPIPNPRGTGEPDDIFFDTSHPDVDFVCSQPPNTIWTEINPNDGEDTCIISGYRLINRLGYYITKIPWTSKGDVVHLNE